MTAPSTAFGRSAIGPVRKSSTSTTLAAASSPAIWVRAPIASLTAVRDPLAPTGSPGVSPAAAFAAPMASELLADVDVLVVLARRTSAR